VKIEIDDSIIQIGTKENYELAIKDLKAIIQQQGFKESHIEPVLLSQTYQKLAAWSFEWKTGPAAVEKLNDKSYEEILHFIQKSTEIN